MNSDPRKYTNTLHEVMDVGLVDKLFIADCALKYLTDEQVEDMCRQNDIFLKEFMEAVEDDD